MARNGPDCWFPPQAVAEPAEFSGQTAVVTGASKGIGRAVAELFAARGANVILVGRGVQALTAVADRLRTNTNVQVSIVAGDVGDPETARAVRAAVERSGRIDVLANIAGAFPTALLADADEAHFAATISGNLTGTYNMSRKLLPVMRQQGSGAIVNMSSMAARFPTPGLSVYGASKAGIEAFTRAIASGGGAGGTRERGVGRPYNDRSRRGIDGFGLYRCRGSGD